MTHRGNVRIVALAVSTAALVTVVTRPGAARADETAYLLNVTVRPGYNFPATDQALTYGRQICAKIEGGERYPQLIAETKDDFGTDDDYQGSYLISQATQELCPELVWQLRNSAAG